MKSSTNWIASIIAVLALAALACGASLPDIPGVTDSGGSGDSGGGGDITNDNGGYGGKNVLTDNFEGRNSTWGVGTDADSSVEYVDGALQFLVYTTNYFVYSTPSDETYENVHIEVDVKNSSTDSRSAFGVMCNVQFIDDSHYYAYITPEGNYAIMLAALAQDDVVLASDSSSLIPQDAASYRFGLDCGNGRVTLYVNGQQIDSVQDSTYTNGTIALFAWSDDAPSGASVTFDNFVMTELR